MIKPDRQDTGCIQQRLTIVWADEDHTYLQLAAKYIRSTSLWSQIQVKYFSEQNKLLEWLGSAIPVNILLVCENWMPRSDELEHVDCTVVVTEEAVINLVNNATVVSKFQNVDKLLGKVLEIHKQGSAALTLTSKTAPSTPQGKVLTVCSTSGGCGKTIVAINLAKTLSAEGFKVFYLSLESYSAFQFWFADSSKDDSQGFSKVLYYLQTNQVNLKEAIKKATYQDELTGIHYFGPLSYMQDIQELSEQHTTNLIKALQDLHNYDYIIIDQEAGSTSRNIAVMKESTHLIWLVLNDASYKSKTKQLFQEWERKDPIGYEKLRLKTQFLLNKHIGTVQIDYATIGIEINAYAPYIPQWKSVQQREQVLNQKIFEEPLQQLGFGLRGTHDYE